LDVPSPPPSSPPYATSRNISRQRVVCYTYSVFFKKEHNTFTWCSKKG
jgi:hypothetical protein